MGVSAHISFDQWPKQGTYLNLRAEVCFRYDTKRVVMGMIVRDDIEGDGTTIIKLDDGRYVLGTECQYRPILGGATVETSANQPEIPPGDMPPDPGPDPTKVDYDHWVSMTKECPSCHGQGFDADIDDYGRSVAGEPCDRCEGAGRI